MFNKFVHMAFFFIVVAAGVAAQTNVNLGGIVVDQNAAVEVTADSLEVDQLTGKAIFSGNVVVLQGDLRLAAATIEVIYVEATGDISRLIASGDVTFVTATEAAEAENAVYDLTSSNLTMTGDVLLTQGNSAIAAQKMVIDTVTGSAIMEGRVRTVLQQGADE